MRSALRTGLQQSSEVTRYQLTRWPTSSTPLDSWLMSTIVSRIWSMTLWLSLLQVCILVVWISNLSCSYCNLRLSLLLDEVSPLFSMTHFLLCIYVKCLYRSRNNSQHLDKLHAWAVEPSTRSILQVIIFTYFLLILSPGFVMKRNLFPQLGTGDMDPFLWKMNCLCSLK